MNRSALEQQLKAHEGYRKYPYLDSLGYATVGWGHWIEKDTLLQFVDMGAALRYYSSRENHVMWFQSDVDRAIKKSKQFFPFRDELTDTRQRILAEMCFVLGNKVRHFVNFKHAAAFGQHSKAAAEMVDSLWHSQAPNRVSALAEQWAEG